MAKNSKKMQNEKAQYIKQNMEILGISEQEAEELWAFDHDEVECEEVEAMEAKAEENKRPKGSPLDKVKLAKAKKKADAEKQGIINMIFEFLAQLGAEHEIINPQEMGSTKMSFKGTNGGYYTVTITKHKTKPDGYVENL